jgi:hypothetical protein
MSNLIARHQALYDAMAKAPTYQQYQELAELEAKIAASAGNPADKLRIALSSGDVAHESAAGALIASALADLAAA